MAKIKAFKAVRFNPEKTDIAKVMMPPYDIIKDSEKYYKQDAHNIIRIDKGLNMEGDTELNNKYTRAAAYVKTWLEEKILKQDEKEAVYIYMQEYNLPDGSKKEMLGFLSLVKVEEFEKKIVLPHEKTHSAAKVDRLELMRTCKGNTSPILSLYFDAEKNTDKILREVTVSHPPVIDTVGEGSCRYRMWAMTDPAIISKISGLFTDKQLFIADGHHRYETAINYRNEMRQTLSLRGEDNPCDYIMMCLISMEHSGISILPTHRVFKEFQYTEVLSSALAKKFFEITRLDSPSALRAKMTARSEKKRFGILHGKDCLLLELKAEAYREALKTMTEHVPEYYMLDVSILHKLIFEDVMGLDYAQLVKTVDYTQDIDEAIKAVVNDTAKIAFLLQATTIEEVKNISLKGDVMPQKSTYFLPKLATGFLIYLMEGN